MREGELRETGDEEAVDAHAGLVGRDDQILHAGGQRLLRRRPRRGFRRRACRTRRLCRSGRLGTRAMRT
jgi:hypothetical protein